MLCVDPSTAPQSLTNPRKTKQNRKLETLHQLPNQFPRNLYKNNIKSMKCYVHRNHKKKLSKTTQNRKLETFQQLSHQFSLNMYKNNIKLIKCYVVTPSKALTSLKQRSKTKLTRKLKNPQL